MKKVLTTTIAVALTIVGIATSCKESTTLQPLLENQVVNVSQPKDDFTETVAASSNPNARAAAAWCPCGRYVKNKTGVPAPVSAKDYGGKLLEAKYYEVTPDLSSSYGNIWAADVIVASNNHPGVNTTHGHVGFPSSVTLVEVKDKKGKVISKYFSIKIKGANQTNDPNKVFTDADCNNVDRNMTVLYYPTTTTLKFYRK